MPVRIEMAGYGPPSVLVPVDRPAWEPGEGEVVVRVAVAGVNRADCFIRAGEWTQGGGFPYVPGLEACGTVERAGPGVDDLAPGDRVITMMQRLGGIHGTRAGGYQATVCVPAETLARVPDGLDLELAGALGLPAVTAMHALERLEVRDGLRVLVQGGSSAVGTMAIQMLRALGCEIVATGTRPAKFELLERLGAAQTVSTRDADWPSRVGPVDRVFDLVGQATFAASVGLLRPGGRLVFVGGTSGGALAFSGWDLMRPVTLTGYSSETMDRAALQRTIDALARHAASGVVRVDELTRLPLREAAKAHELLESGAVAGRVVLVP